MRLIDADALKEEIEFHPTSVSVCMTAEQARGETNFKMRCLEDIDNAPTINAIPVEWINNLRWHYMIEGRTESEGDLTNLLLMWQKEHDLDNSDKSGVWEPLGHRIGFCKHPWSEDFKCPLCGYEAYTVLNPPPDRCPKCHAELSFEQEGA